MNCPCLKIRTLLFSVLVIATIAGCNKKDDTLVLRTTSAFMSSTKTLQLDISPGPEGCIFETDNDFIASVSSTGLITANLVGEAHITVTNTAKGFTASCKVTVQPEHQMFRIPYLNFNSYKQPIKDYETRYFYAEDDSTLIYIGENESIDALFYFFENFHYTLSTCMIPATDPDHFQEFIAERYFLLNSDNQFTTLMTPDSKTLVGIESGITIGSDIYYAVYYMPFIASKSSGFPKPEIDRIKQNYLKR